MPKLLENHSRKLFRQLTFNRNFAKYFAIWRKNLLNSFQDFVTGSCQTCFYYFPPQKTLTIFRWVVYFEINNKKISDISIRKNSRVRVMLWTCSHFNIDSAICMSGFHKWITELVNMKKHHFLYSKTVSSYFEI